MCGDHDGSAVPCASCGGTEREWDVDLSTRHTLWLTIDDEKDALWYGREPLFRLDDDGQWVFVDAEGSTPMIEICAGDVHAMLAIDSLAPASCGMIIDMGTGECWQYEDGGADEDE